MSGIFGAWNLAGGPVDPGDLERMSGLLSHRGPEAANVWLDGPVGLGHRASHTLPESRGETQPLVDGERGRILVADIRIDNREELIRALGQPCRRGGDPGDPGDATLLIAAWVRWGDRCVERLIGDFAFAVWDAREGSLFCARDHFGVRPLYYHHAPGRLFAFASEIEALLALPDVPDEIDEIEVARHLRVPIRGEPDATYYRHVRRLPPARILTASQRGLADRTYWEPDPDRRTRLGSDEAYAEAFRSVFEEAVRCRLRSTGPVASMLSGGIDSAAITCMAARIAESVNSPLHTLSAIYPDVPDSDERPFIHQVLDRHDVEPHFFEADARSPIDDIDRMNRFIGGPNHGTNLYLNWELFGLAGKVGARVVLDGFDGDTTVSHGKGYLVELSTSGRWLRLARVALPYLEKQSDTPFSDYLSIVRFGIRRRLRDSGWWRRVRPARGAPGPPPSSMVDEGFAARWSGRGAELPAPPTTEREMHRYALTSSNLLEAVGWIEACGAGRGVEVRFPFFDVRLAEFCLSLPPDQKIRRGWSRWVLRRAMEGVLPPSIQWRPGKADLHSGWRYAMRSNKTDRIKALLREPGAVAERYLDLERLRPLCARFLSGGTTRSEEVDLWRALSLALWLKTEASVESSRSERTGHDSERVSKSG